ncbi:hypothetical protein HDV00_009574 [Rhizophlyctis rosea]|nr:hypothetical protein HDV00_009574 [Rhizophlyctis rosea]
MIVNDVHITDDTSKSLKDTSQKFIQLLMEIRDFVAKLNHQTLIKRFLLRREIDAEFDSFAERLNDTCTTFQLAINIQIHQDQRNIEEEAKKDRANDQREIDKRLEEVVDNERRILEILEIQPAQYFEALEALGRIQKRADAVPPTRAEAAFVEKAKETLIRLSNRPSGMIRSEPWSITSWEIEMDEKPIASGGCGEILLGLWFGHTKVAIKRLHLSASVAGVDKMERYRADFNHEVRVWYPLKHQNVLPLLAACGQADRPFMVMPYLKNGTLLQYVEKKPARKIQLLYEVAQGMAFLHSRGLVHADLKAINVLVDDGGHAQITDFGFSSIKIATTTLRTARVMGPSSTGLTLRWAAPELIRGYLESDMPPRPTTATDVYAFAITCYEILAGCIPFEGTPEMAIPQVVVHRKRRPAKPGYVGEERFPAALWTGMEKWWDDDPTKRPAFSMICATFKGVLMEMEDNRDASSTAQNLAIGEESGSEPLVTVLPAPASPALPVVSGGQMSSESSSGSRDSGANLTPNTPMITPPRSPQILPAFGDLTPLFNSARSGSDVDASSSPKVDVEALLEHVNKMMGTDIESIKRKADAGDPDAQANLGLHYEHGESVPEDLNLAAYYYHLSATQNQAKGAKCLAVCYLYGRGVPKSESEGIEWLTKAAEWGHVQAQDYLGDCYRGGFHGVTKSDTKAVEWYRKAVEGGSLDAAVSLALCMMGGKGLEKDEQGGIALLLHAAQEGSRAGQYKYALLIESGMFGIARDASECAKWMEKAADQGHAAAMYKLATFYMQGWVDGSVALEDVGVMLFRELTHPIWKLYRYGVARDLHQGMSWLRRAADAGDEDAIKLKGDLAKMAR